MNFKRFTRSNRSPEKQSMREAMVHLFARYLEMRPLFLAAARPMKVEWKMSPYLGVLPRVFRALWGRNCWFHIQDAQLNSKMLFNTKSEVLGQQVHPYHWQKWYRCKQMCFLISKLHLGTSSSSPQWLNSPTLWTNYKTWEHLYIKKKSSEP